jgi:anaerobic selenocysteine-containing dehydrogenase
VGEQTSAVVEQPLVGNWGRPGGHGGLKVQRTQGAHAVGGQVHAGPGDLPAGLSFDQLWREPGLAQRSGQREAGQPCPYDQDPVVRVVAELPHRAPLALWLVLRL